MHRVFFSIDFALTMLTETISITFSFIQWGILSCMVLWCMCFMNVYVPLSQNWYVFSRWTTIKDLTCHQTIHIDGHQWLKLPTFHFELHVKYFRGNWSKQYSSIELKSKYIQLLFILACTYCSCSRINLVKNYCIQWTLSINKSV